MYTHFSVKSDPNAVVTFVMLNMDSSFSQFCFFVYHGFFLLFRFSVFVSFSRCLFLCGDACCMILGSGGETLMG